MSNILSSVSSNPLPNTQENHTSSPNSVEDDEYDPDSYDAGDDEYPYPFDANGNGVGPVTPLPFWR